MIPPQLARVIAPLEVVAPIASHPFAHVLHVRDAGQDRALKWGDHDAIVREHRALARIDHPGVVPTLALYRSPPHAAHLMPLLPGQDWSPNEGGHSPPLQPSEITAGIPPTGQERNIAQSVAHSVVHPAALRRNLPQAFGYDLQEEGRSAYRACSAAQAALLRQRIPALADALQAVHSAGFLHLDVAPDNVRIAHGRPILLDLGLVLEQGTLPGPCTLVGSAAYLAPEVAERPSPASDAYSLGVLLFESLTGGRPFDGGGPEVLVRKQSVTAPRASDVSDGVPPDLDDLCAALLARSPSGRPALSDVARLTLSG